MGKYFSLDINWELYNKYYSIPLVSDLLILIGICTILYIYCYMYFVFGLLTYRHVLFISISSSKMIILLYVFNLK